MQVRYQAALRPDEFWIISEQTGFLRSIMFPNVNFDSTICFGCHSIPADKRHQYGRMHGNFAHFAKIPENDGLTKQLIPCYDGNG